MVTDYFYHSLSTHNLLSLSNYPLTSSFSPLTSNETEQAELAKVELFKDFEPSDLKRKT